MGFSVILQANSSTRWPSQHDKTLLHIWVSLQTKHQAEGAILSPHVNLQHVAFRYPHSTACYQALSRVRVPLWTGPDLTSHINMVVMCCWQKWYNCGLTSLHNPCLASLPCPPPPRFFFSVSAALPEIYLMGCPAGLVAIGKRLLWLPITVGLAGTLVTQKLYQPDSNFQLSPCHSFSSSHGTAGIQRPPHWSMQTMREGVRDTQDLISSCQLFLHKRWWLF